MRTTLPMLVSGAAALLCTQCGGQSVTGAANETGGASEGGHSSAAQTSHSGGIALVGGAAARGGTSSRAGSTTTGGSSAAGVVGGSFGTGGMSQAGATYHGTTTGGRGLATGGARASGGMASTGGFGSGGGTSNFATGGIGASVVIGGTNSGGTTAVGGVVATGGAKPTAGASSAGASGHTGGSIANGGTSGHGTQPIWPKKFCGNITTSNKTDPSGLDYAKHWDQVTPENAGKWPAVQPGPSAAFNWSTLDAIYAYAEQHGILFKENTFVWGTAMPAGIYTAAHVEHWIESFCGRYPKTALIDVVNEPPPHTQPTYAAALGQGEGGTYPWITRAFKLARKYCGSAVLILNDYNNLEYASQQSHFIDIVKDMKANGAPIDAIGAEAHDTSAMTASALQASLDTLSLQTGLPVYITEYDVNESNDSKQLAIYQAQMPIFWNSSNVLGVTMWGWITGSTWRSYTGLVTGTTPRPAMTWLMGYLGRPTPP